MKREPVQYQDIPEQLVQAVIAAEDENFFLHPGVDYKGILRAVVHLIKTGQKGQGGSTITMQVARNFFLTRDKTYIRKINEIFLALKIEKFLSKEDIMALYMNKIYLGHRSYGVAAAAKTYYGLPLQDLSLEQYAMIAGLPKAPSKYNPVTNPERATIRRNYVLGRMQQLNFITQEQYQQALQVEAPYIAEMVRSHMVSQYGDEAYTNGYNVFTTISSPLQTAANVALRSALMAYEHRHGYKGIEEHIDLPPENTPVLEIVALLNKFRPVGNLQPALIMTINEVEVQLKSNQDKKPEMGA